MSSSLSMFQHKIQPRSSAERDNSLLLHSALKAASTDIAHRLLDYASLDKIDCEASCILISLANHEPSLPKNHDLEPKKNMKEETVVDQPIVVEEKKVHVAPTSKTDPIMLLMAAAKVVDGNDLKMERKKRHSHQRSMDREAYPNGRYYLKQNNKRIRTSPPSPAPTNTSHYKVDTWQKTKVNSYMKKTQA
ncbi:hypothetical protein INT47_012333 [Mucor saturninus]|uniref:Uncharacterized protein n=1 Tax=Mucor saturninus TaxID=64648 RepID=A0A8H7QYA3_9FUNG|nr:hypothetical protein INT47_012333 [Mucor saturninus]